VEVCPVDCIVNDPDNVENQASLFEKYERLEQADDVNT
jgi:hypothetical protein